MKTRLFYLFLAAIALGLTSCHTYTDECNSNTHVHTQRVILDLQINPNDWSYSGVNNSNYFYATFNIEQLTKEVYDNGVVSVYREYDYGTDQATQTELPLTRYYEYLSDSISNQWSFFCEHIDYEYNIGTITIYYIVSDFNYEIDEYFVPDEMHFRASLVW